MTRFIVWKDHSGWSVENKVEVGQNGLKLDQMIPEVWYLD